MRTWFWTLLLAVVAVALALVLREHAGNVLVLVPPWRIELSLMLAVFLLIGLFVALYLGLRALAWLVAIPARVRGWRGRRAQARDHELLERGWIGLLEGHYAAAEKDLAKLLEQTRVAGRQVLAALSAARAAHGLGEFARRDRYLDEAAAKTSGEAGLHEAVATVAADLLLDEGRPQDALARLAPLQKAGGARHLHTQRLLLRAHRALGHHEQTFTLARSLSRRGTIAGPEAIALIEASAAARLRGACGDDWRAVWKDLKPEERVLPEIALAGSAALDAGGQSDEASRVLEAAIARRMDPRLLAAYARCEPEQVSRRLEKAEGWLQAQPGNPDLLSTLGVLCLTGQLWGQAERYLLRSLGRRNDARAHALLGSLYDRVDRPVDAARHWRLATAAGMALPVLAADAALPPADTGADPALLHAEGMEYLADAAPATVPLPAAGRLPGEAATDYVLDPYARDHDPSQTAPLAGAAASADIEDFFDSAPIPVAAPAGGTPRDAGQAPGGSSSDPSPGAKDRDGP